MQGPELSSLVRVLVSVLPLYAGFVAPAVFVQAVRLKSWKFAVVGSVLAASYVGWLVWLWVYFFSSLLDFDVVAIVIALCPPLIGLAVSLMAIWHNQPRKPLDRD